MRRLFGTGLAVAVFALVVGCGKKPDTSGPGSAAKGIEGGWTLVSIEFAGEKDPGTEKKTEADRTIRATSDKLIATKNGKDDPLSYKIDYSKTPNEIDLTETKDDGKPHVMYGICKLEGDMLTICAGLSDKPADRPKEFKSTKDNPTLMMTLKKK